MKTLRASLVLLALSALPVSAQVTLTPTISGNEVKAKIELPGGFAADLSIVFEQVVGLNANALALTAAVVDPTDVSLVSRFPGALVSLPAAFPVLVRVDPPAGSALSFSGVYKLSIHTHNLTFQANSPLRLYRSSAGGPFKDMTGTLEMGSVRAGGSGPGFSEFLIVADVRNPNSVILEKLAALENGLSQNASSISPPVYSDLTSRLSQIRSLITTGAIPAAIDAVAAFGAEVKAQSGTAIADVWRANGNLVNVAGMLRSGADTLRFSLVLKSNSGV